MDRQPQIVLQRKARTELERLHTDGNTAQKIAKRARIVLTGADGHGVMAIVVGVSKPTIWRWQEYFVEAGVEGRSKAPGKKPISAAIKLKIFENDVEPNPETGYLWQRLDRKCWGDWYLVSTAERSGLPMRMERHCRQPR